MNDPYHVLAYLLGFAAVMVYLFVANLIPKGPDGRKGLVVGEDGRLSTSKFQFFLWTGIVVFSYVALFVADVENFAGKDSCPAPPSNSSQPGVLADPWCRMADIPQNVLIAMGFTLITLATAKGVTTAYVASGRVISTKGSASLADLVTQDDGVTPDLSKVQMLTWTAIAAATYLFAVFKAIPTFQGADFPDINPTLMLLMGLGQAAYLGTKIVSAQNTIISNLTPARGAGPGSQITINGSGFGTSLGTIQFGDVVAAPAMSSGGPQWSDTSVTFIIPPTQASGQPFAGGQTVYVAVLLQGNNTTAASNTVPYTF
jgi:hypothetical protein